MAMDVQLDPISDQPIHADFRRIEKDTLVRVPVPVRFLNEGAAPGIKVGGVLTSCVTTSKCAASRTICRSHRHRSHRP